jgi:hypothetical protein
MAVQSATSSISYTGNNSTVTTYAVPFYFLENAHLAAIAKVTATGVESAVTLTNHTGAGDINGGTVRTAVAVPATSTLNIFRTVPATQTTSYAEGGDFPAASHERALDKLTFLSQQNERAVERSFRVTEGSGTKNEVVAVANSVLTLDSNNQPKALNLADFKQFIGLVGTTLSVPAGIKTFADAAARSIAVPDFTGQLASQQDTADIYISTGTAAGDWSLVDENMSLADFASGFFTADATGRGKFGSGFVDSGLLAADAVTTAKIEDDAVTTAKIEDDAVTTAKIEDDAVTTAKIEDGAVTPVKLSQPYTLATSVASTSGTSIDFTGIPSWARRVTVMFNGVSTGGTSIVQIQIGSSSFSTSGYKSNASYGSSSAVQYATATSGFIIDPSGQAAAGTARSGTYTLVLIGSNVWVGSGTNAESSAGATTSCAGNAPALSAALDRVRITTVNGSDTFDAGTINISYEG